MLKIEPEPYSCLHPALNFLPALNSSAFPGANNAISTEEGCGYVLKLEDLKVRRRSPELLNNVKIGQVQLQLIMEQILFYHNGVCMGVAAILVK